ncbi:pseudouridine synthase [Flavobacterium sp.]|uniref:pseudouridine synthase n=1 Tax=Flavobacterium sp. TaxID=239 RepID=UPI003BC8D400
MNNSNKKRPGPSKPSADRKKTSPESKPAMAKRSQNRKPVVKKDSPNIPKPIKSDEIRLNKYIANSGACSRRDADIYIQSGNVKVNGIAVTEMGYKIKPGDIVNFDGATLMPEKKEYFVLNKPKNFTTSNEEVEHRHVLELIKGASTSSLSPVGRMDKNTTGLLLFTNDTDIIRKFSLPNQKSPKIYQVTLDKNLKFEDLEKINTGVTIDGHRLFIDDISYIENEPKNEIGIKLRTPNVKVVRAIFENFKYTVIKVDRVAYAGLTKKNLPRGNWRALTDQEIINLKNI